MSGDKNRKEYLGSENLEHQDMESLLQAKSETTRLGLLRRVHGVIDIALNEACSPNQHEKWFVSPEGMLLSEDRKPIVATNSVFTEDLTEVHIDGKTLRELYEVKDEGIVVADKHFVFFVDLHSRYNSKITIIGVPEYFEKLGEDTEAGISYFYNGKNLLSNQTVISGEIIPSTFRLVGGGFARATVINGKETEEGLFQYGVQVSLPEGIDVDSVRFIGTCYCTDKTGQVWYQDHYGARPGRSGYFYKLPEGVNGKYFVLAENSDSWTALYTDGANDYITHNKVDYFNDEDGILTRTAFTIHHGVIREQVPVEDVPRLLKSGIISQEQASKDKRVLARIRTLRSRRVSLQKEIDQIGAEIAEFGGKK